MAQGTLPGQLGDEEGESEQRGVDALLTSAPSLTFFIFIISLAIRHNKPPIQCPTSNSLTYPLLIFYSPSSFAPFFVCSQFFAIFMHYSFLGWLPLLMTAAGELSLVFFCWYSRDGLNGRKVWMISEWMDVHVHQTQLLDISMII